jgi:hypothetical protein
LAYDKILDRRILVREESSILTENAFSKIRVHSSAIFSCAKKKMCPRELFVSTFAALLGGRHRSLDNAANHEAFEIEPSFIGPKHPILRLF